MVLVTAWSVAACARETPPLSKESSQQGTPQKDLAVLPNNTAIYAEKQRIVAVRREGDFLWEATLPANDVVIAPVGVALNSTAYVRGLNALHAVSPDGKWTWSKPLGGQAYANTPAVNAPATFPDSTVAVAVGDDIIRFDDKGSVTWRVTLPEGHVVAPLRAGMDGALFASTSAGMYCFGPDGAVLWRRAVGN